MSKQRMLATAGLIGSVLVLVLVLALEYLPARPAKADTVISYQTVTLFDGKTAYTDTQYSSGYLGAGFAHVQIHVSQTTISPTEVITYTPQFSLQPVGCGSIATWFDAGTWSGGTKTDVYLALTATITEGRELTMDGRCMRIKVEPLSATGYTPTLYIRMLNK